MEVIRSESDNDQADEHRSALLPDQIRSNSTVEEEEEKVGDIVDIGGTSYFIIDIFEKEIMELGDQVDLNFNQFNKFETLNGDAPSDHHFYSYRCCYSSCFCCCSTSNVEREWRNLERELSSDGFINGVSFFVRTYSERPELMRVAVTVVNGDQSRSLFFFDLIFPKEYPHRAPSFFYHEYGLPSETLKTIKDKRCYNILDAFHHIQEIVVMNKANSCHQMLDMLKQPLIGFEDFVKGYYRKNGALILQKKMMENENDRNIFWKLYVAFEDNKAYCGYLLNDDLKEELKRLKEGDDLSSDLEFDDDVDDDDDKKLSKFQNFWCRFLGFMI